MSFHRPDTHQVLAAAMAASIALASLAQAPAAHAVNERILPGSICQPEAGAAPFDYLYLRGAIKRTKVYASGEVPRQDQYVHCLLPRDASTPDGIKYVYVRMSKHTNRVPVYCTLNTYGGDGKPDSGHVAMVPRSTTGNAYVRFWRPANTHAARGVKVSCNLPGSDSTGNLSAIHSIRYGEF